MKKSVLFLCFVLCISFVLNSGCASSEQVISCNTQVIPDGMYVCSVECPSGEVQTSSIWIEGQPNRYTNADILDYYTEEEVPDTLTCTSAGPARCGATCA